MSGAREGPLGTQAFLTSPFPAPRRTCGAAARPRLLSGSMTTVCKVKRTTARNNCQESIGGRRSRRSKGASAGGPDGCDGSSLPEQPSGLPVTGGRETAGCSVGAGGPPKPLCDSAPLRFFLFVWICVYLCDLWASSCLRGSAFLAMVPRNGYLDAGSASPEHLIRAWTRRRARARVSPYFSPDFVARGARYRACLRSRKIWERRRTCGTSSEQIEKTQTRAVHCDP